MSNPVIDRGIACVLVLAGICLLLNTVGYQIPFAIFNFPGTVCHEAAHYLVALATGGTPSHFDVMPAFVDGRLTTLGSVSIEDASSFSLAASGLAPLLLLPLCVLVFAAATRCTFRAAVVLVYVAYTLFISALPSGPDFTVAKQAAEGWFAAGLFLLCISTLIILLAKRISR
jgi:hypothetical protein